MLSGKKIIVGISGGIAAYKTPLLIRLLIKAGAEVKVIASKSALQFVTPLTLQTVSKNEVYFDLFAAPSEVSTEHVSITDWADLFVLAPATGNIIGKLTHGIADDALSTALMAFDKKIMLAPAMNVKMWQSPAVVENCEILRRRNIDFIGPDSGDLACGYEATGRMVEPECLFERIKQHFLASDQLHGKKILVSAGPTNEAIDPVRFIGNHSSGLMGFAIAEALANAGAEVVLVAGPVQMKVHHPSIKRIDVVSAQEMYDACVEHFPSCNGAIMAAAVADYRVENPSTQKIKKQEQELTLHLVKNKDILAQLGQQKNSAQVLIGFALETNNDKENAVEKLKRKNLDLIVLNNPTHPGSGFKTSTNKVMLIDRLDNCLEFPLLPKTILAEKIVTYITPLLLANE